MNTCFVLYHTFLNFDTFIIVFACSFQLKYAIDILLPVEIIMLDSNRNEANTLYRDDCPASRTVQ